MRTPFAGKMKLTQDTSEVDVQFESHLGEAGSFI
jgi:hypothetical protein